MAMGLDPSTIECSVSIVAFTALFSLYFCIMLLVALLRTYVILQNRKNRRGQSRYSGSSWVPILTLAQSWLCVGIYLVVVVIFHAYGSANNVFVFLLGLESLLFGIGSDQWVNKLIRLGSRIIISPTKQKQMQQTHHQNSQLLKQAVGAKLPRKSVIQLAPAVAEVDALLKFLIWTNRLVLVIQFTFLCIVAMVLPTQRQWLQAGVGLLAGVIFLALTALWWQYHRCEKAMLETQKGVMGSSTAPHWISAVRFKFFIHRLVIAALGIPAIVIAILWAAEVIPINHVFLLVFGFLDVATNSLMILTFIRNRSISKSRTGASRGTTQAGHSSAPREKENNSVSPRTVGDHSSAPRGDHLSVPRGDPAYNSGSQARVGPVDIVVREGSSNA